VASQGNGGGDLTNVQCTAIRNCHDDSPLNNGYILLKMRKKKVPVPHILIYTYLFLILAIATGARRRLIAF
jgi:hypothetical protein